MKRTHKKILGFAGLGLVAAVTTVAATTQVPGAFAITAVSDEIQVRVLAGDPEVTVTSTSGTEVTSPDYSFTVAYDNIVNLKAVLVNRNADGVITWEEQLFDEPVSLEPGEMTKNLNLDDYNGKGNFTITITGTSEEGVPVEKIISVVYTDVPPAPIEPEDDKPTINPDVPEAETKTVEITIYDEDGEVVMHRNIADPSSVENIDTSGLPDGLYKVEVVTRDKNGNITSTKVFMILVGTGEDLPVKIEEQSEEIDHAIVTVKDSTGTIVLPAMTIPHPTPGSIITLDLADLAPGVYTITTDYYNSSDALIGTTSVTFTKYGSSDVDIDVVQKVDTVTTVEAYIYNSDGKLARIIKADRATGKVSVYDPDGNLLFTLDNAYSDSTFTIPMEGLPYGDYTGTMMYRNAEGKLVGDSKTFKIQYYGSAIIVPDTGSFFQGLNISREDYLITGLIIFVVIGAVAFWIVKRNRKNNR